MTGTAIDAQISVVVPVRDGERYLAETLDSIVGQTLEPHEVIVVDDGSQDSSATIARSFGGPVRVITSRPVGGGAARDLGVAQATGNLVALCDADDLWMAHKLARQVAEIGDLNQPTAVFCAAAEFLSPELTPESLRTRQPMDHIARAQISSALLATRPALDAAGAFQTEADDGLWFSWCVRLLDSSATIGYAHDVLVRRRLHDRNQSLETAPATGMWPAALHAHLLQRRNNPS